MAEKPAFKRVRIDVWVSPKVKKYIEFLARTGLYGRGARSQAAERLICNQIEQLVDHPLFRDEFRRLNPQVPR